MREENAKNGQKGVVIMNVTSVGGYIGYPGQAFYHASEFFVEGWTEAVAKEVPSTWNSKFHLCNIELGGVKTNYATSSLKQTAVRHQAYSDPSFPANMLLSHIGSEQGRAFRGKRVPIRVPLGVGAWGLVDKNLENTKGDLDEIKDISYSVVRKYGNWCIKRQGCPCVDEDKAEAHRQRALREKKQEAWDESYGKSTKNKKKVGNESSEQFIKNKNKNKKN
ncbi:hypothetical protein F5B19DRAFT_498206 [Rostrohypoxylon terebratum]|nr:hypothetical protein F5B19DRAFT_498206 [Rostrohypoxylon terebratum]